MSPYLEPAPRSQARALHDWLLKGDFWEIVELTGNGPEPIGERYRFSLAECVRDIATGDGVSGRALAVVCLNFCCATSEVIDHDKLVSEVYTYITRECLDDPDQKWDCPFLDESCPDWRNEFRREWNYERQAKDDARFYARAGI